MNRVFVLGAYVDAVTQDEAVAGILRLARTRGRHMVVTPNVDHVIRMRRDAHLREIYRSAALVLADGMPLVWASRLTRTPLPERVAGADLIAPVLAGAERDGLSVFFLGPMRDTLDIALSRFAVQFPGLRIAGSHSPPFGFEADPLLDAQCPEALRAANPDIVIACLGAPKQELWIFRKRREVGFGIALCLGAALDFVAGFQKRCPPAIGRLGLEWAWRVGNEPRRLWRRYAQCLLLAPVLMWEQVRYARRHRAKG